MNGLVLFICVAVLAVAATLSVGLVFGSNVALLVGAPIGLLCGAGMVVIGERYDVR